MAKNSCCCHVGQLEIDRTGLGSTSIFNSQILHTIALPETNSSHLKMDGWKTSFLLGWLPDRCYVGLREGISGARFCTDIPKRNLRIFSKIPSLKRKNS